MNFITVALRLNFTDPAYRIYFGPIGVVLSQTSKAINGQSQNKLLDNFKLEQNYPNPFNPSTKINYFVASPNSVKINIFNSNGELLKTLVNEEQSIEEISVVWNGKDNYGKIVSSGVYFYQLQRDNTTNAKK